MVIVITNAAKKKSKPNFKKGLSNGKGEHVNSNICMPPSRNKIFLTTLSTVNMETNVATTLKPPVLRKHCHQSLKSFKEPMHKTNNIDASELLEKWNERAKGELR